MKVSPLILAFGAAGAAFGIALGITVQRFGTQFGRTWNAYANPSKVCDIETLKGDAEKYY